MSNLVKDLLSAIVPAHTEPEVQDTPENQDLTPATDKQVAFATKLCQQLGKNVEDIPTTKHECSAFIGKCQKELKDLQSKSSKTEKKATKSAKADKVEKIAKAEKSVKTSKPADKKPAKVAEQPKQATSSLELDIVKKIAETTSRKDWTALLSCLIKFLDMYVQGKTSTRQCVSTTESLLKSIRSCLDKGANLDLQGALSLGVICAKGNIPLSLQRESGLLRGAFMILTLQQLVLGLCIDVILDKDKEHVIDCNDMCFMCDDFWDYRDQEVIVWELFTTTRGTRYAVIEEF